MTLTRAVLLPFLLYTLFNFTTMVVEVPTVRLFEHALCVRTLRRLELDEAECKSTGIQNTLSLLVGWKLTLDACAGLLTAMLYGSVAEGRGERLVLSLSLLGYAAMQLIDVLICSFPLIAPVQTVWLSSLLLLVGGGQRIYNSMVFTLVANALDARKRTIFMYWLAFGPHCMRFIAPRIAAKLMSISLLAPFWLAVAILAIMLSIIPLVIESKVLRESVSDGDYEPINESDRPDSEALNQPQSRDSDEQVLPHCTTSPQATDETLPCNGTITGAQHRIVEILLEKYNDTTTLLCNRATNFCIAVVYLKRLGFASSSFAFQYVSEKFGWRLQDTTWLRVVSGAGAIAIGLLAPLVTTALVRRGTNPPFVDLISIRLALIILSVSFFATWEATSGTTVLCFMFGIGFGEGLEPALQGFMSFAAGSFSSSRVFTTYAFFDAAAELTSGPVMARLMAIGRTDHHPSDGYSFLASSIIFASLLIWSCFVRASHP